MPDGFGQAVPTMRQVVDETMRLYPPLPLMLRSASRRR